MHHKKNSFTEQAWSKIADIYKQQHIYDSAYVAYSQLEKIADSKKRLFNARVGMMRMSYQNKTFKDVILACDKVLTSEKLPEDIKRETHFKKGMAYYKTKQYSNAQQEFRLITDNAVSEQAARAKYLIGKIYYLQGEYQKAQREIKDFVGSNSPHHYWIGKSFILLSDIYAKQDEIFQAKATLQSIIDNYTAPNDGIIDTAHAKLLHIIKLQKARDSVERVSTDSVSILKTKQDSLIQHDTTNAKQE